MMATIEIHYLSEAGGVLQRGNFKVNFSVEQTALEFLQEIEREVEVLKVEKIIHAATNNITDKVLALKNAPLN